MGNCLVIQDSREEVNIVSKAVPRSFTVPGALGDKPSSSPLGTDDDGVFSSLLPSKAPAAAAVDPGDGVRVKLVVSKQELRNMLGKDGVSLDDVMVSLMRKEAGYGCEVGIDEREGCGGWRPVLESIPEGSLEI